MYLHSKETTQNGIRSREEKGSGQPNVYVESLGPEVITQRTGKLWSSLEMREGLSYQDMPVFGHLFCDGREEGNRGERRGEGDLGTFSKPVAWFFEGCNAAP